MHMRAWEVREPAPIDQNPLDLVTRAVPDPEDDEVLVRVRACGICRTDLHVAEGDLPVRRARVVPGHQIVGTVAARGAAVRGLAVGTRVGVAWLHRTCGRCPFCTTRRENLCDAPDFTGWTVDGGFAEYAVAPADFVHPLPEGFADVQAAPLLCAGIIGYRALAHTELGTRRGARLGIWGFGAAGHVVIQLARFRGLEVYVATRDRARHQALAQELGAVWTGDSGEPPPVPLDAAIVFAPAGELVPVALRALGKGGRLVLGGIHMSDVPSFPYELLYGERSVCSVANNTRADARAFLAEAARIPVRTHVQEFPFTQADHALRALAHDGIRGAGVVRID